VSYKGLSLWGRAGLALFAVHAVLLFFPPIPPDVKGSLWWWLTAYIAIVLLLVETGRQPRALPAAWAGLPPGRRWAMGLGLVFAVLVLGAALRSYMPSLYEHFHREEGLFEPVALYCYLASAIVLFAGSRQLRGPERRHWQFVAWLYLLLGLEEIDYFGVFGGLIGRVQGIYVGSPHDLIMLAARGVLSPLTWVVIAAVCLLLILVLWWTDYLQPRALWAMVGSVDFLWVSVGLGFLFAAAVGEAGLFDLVMAEPTLEETLELCGSLCFFFYALSVVGRPGRRSSRRLT